jgi:hypothetical protein
MQSLLAMDGQHARRLPDLREPSGLDRKAYIRALYNLALQRDPEPEVLSKLLARDDFGNFFSEVLSSPEFRRLARSPAYAAARSLKPSNPVRVLLFGAYGNGNLGDAIQAASLGRAINAVRPEIEVWACSALTAPYPFAHERVLPSDAILDPAVLNSFDLLIIGGGGLLSHPHDPLTDPNWAAVLQVPFALLGVGASEPVAGKNTLLIRKAAYVSGRDAPSVTTLRKYRMDVDFVPDPVLCDISFLKRQATPSRFLPSRERRLWILKPIAAPAFLNLCKQISHSDDVVCFIEPHLDFPLIEILPNAKPIYFLEELISLIDEADQVLSMRYHGCILSMLRGKEVIGLYETKCSDLLDRYGNKELFSVTPTYNPGPKEISYLPIEGTLAKDQLSFFHGLSKALSFVAENARQAGIERNIKSLSSGSVTSCSMLATDPTLDPSSKILIEELVTGAYKAILGRSADPSGLRTYGKYFTRQSPGEAIKHVVESLLRSSEYKNKNITHVSKGRKPGGSVFQSDCLFVQTADLEVYQNLLKTTSKTVIEYCKRHNFKYESFVGIMRGNCPWHATFNRILLLRRLLETEFQGWVCYLDADALIVDLDFDLRRFLTTKNDIALIAAGGGDPEVWWNINAGVFLLNLAHPFGKAIVRKWHQTFSAITDDQLRLMKDWSKGPDDQSLLHRVLRSIPDAEKYLFVDRVRPHLINYYEGRFIRQLIRESAVCFDERKKILALKLTE